MNQTFFSRVLFCSAIGLLFVACGPKTPSEVVAKSLAVAVCGKQKECSPGSAFATEACEQGLTLGYGNALRGKAVPTKNYQDCLDGFKTFDCSRIQQNRLPEACSTFIKSF